MHLMLHARWQGDYQEEAWKEVQQIKNAQTHATQTQHVTHLMLHARWRGGYEEEARRKEVQRSGTGRKVGEAALVGEQREERG